MFAVSLNKVCHFHPRSNMFSPRMFASQASIAIPGTEPVRSRVATRTDASPVSDTHVVQPQTTSVWDLLCLVPRGQFNRRVLKVQRYRWSIFLLVKFAVDQVCGLLLLSNTAHRAHRRLDISSDELRGSTTRSTRFMKGRFTTISHDRQPANSHIVPSTQVFLSAFHNACGLLSTSL
jgi:hypothetical protein